MSSTALLVGLALVAVAPVLVGQLPGSQRVLLPGLEPPQLLVLGQVQPELHQDHALGGEGLLELADLPVGPAPLLVGGEALDPLDQHPAVPGPVEDGHPAPAGQRRPEPPEEVVPLLVVRRRGELRDADVPRVERRDEPLDAAALARRRPSPRTRCTAAGRAARLADEPAAEQSQLKQPLLGGREPAASSSAESRSVRSRSSRRPITAP